VKQSEFTQLSSVTRVLYLKEFQKVQGILEDEAALRRQISLLDVQAAQARDALRVEHAMQTVGADLLWQGWQTRMRHRLNLELAQVLAKKITVMDRVRTAFGRQNAVRTMADMESAVRQKRLQKLRENQLLAPQLMRSSAGDDQVS